jgi:2-(1,2-epoxy-1,2-dihydrophenyl)acetyl-CoA isomerase
MEELVQRLAGGPTVALGLMKWLVHRSQEEGLEQSLTNEGFALELSSRGKDFREGLAAFKEKRPPRFEGR